MTNIILTQRQLCDLDLILNQGFYPLRGFLNQDDYISSLNTMRLTSGHLWPMPIVLDVSADVALTLSVGKSVLLVDKHLQVLAELKVESIYKPDKVFEATCIFGSSEKGIHSGIDYLYQKIKEYYVGGTVNRVSNDHVQFWSDFAEYRKTPAQLRAYFEERQITRVVGFQTRNPIHCAHFEMTMRALETIKSLGEKSHLLLHPAVGETRCGDIDYVTRVKCYLSLADRYPKDEVTLSLLPLAMRMAGPREALLHAIIRKNYGCTHFIVGRDHAGVPNNKTGEPFYDPYAAQALVNKYAREIGLEILTYKQIVYVENLKCYKSMDEITPTDTILTLSGTQLRSLLYNGEPIPPWFTFPEIMSILSTASPAKHSQGLTIFFTGLSCSGKSTLALTLKHVLPRYTDRSIIVLDGDEIRTHLSADLSFTQQDRETNINRIGYVASVITRCRSIAIVACIAPYQESRLKCRQLVGEHGNFVEIYLATPLSECEARDIKGLYKKARAKQISHFTGISDTYEIPVHPDMVIDTSQLSISECIDSIIGYLVQNNYLVAI